MQPTSNKVTERIRADSWQHRMDAALQPATQRCADNQEALRAARPACLARPRVSRQRSAPAQSVGLPQGQVQIESPAEFED